MPNYLKIETLVVVDTYLAVFHIPSSIAQTALEDIELLIKGGYERETPNWWGAPNITRTSTWLERELSADMKKTIAVFSNGIVMYYKQ